MNMNSKSYPSPEHAYIDSPHRNTPYSAAFSSNIIAYSLLGLLSAYYLLHHLDYYPLLSLHELLWNCLVYVTPASLVTTLDRRAKQTGTFQDYSKSRTFATNSEAMRHLLSFDAGSAFLNFRRPRRLYTLSTVFKTSTKETPPGLGNWDNSCYQNSVLQGLASLHSVSVFLSQEISISSSNETAPTREALRTLIRNLNDPCNEGRRLWTPAELKSMSSWQQQDAQEYFSKILDEIEKETSRSMAYRSTTCGLLDLGDPGVNSHNGSEPRSHISNEAALSTKVRPRHGSESNKLPEELRAIVLRNPLEGLLAQRVGCLKCGYVEGLSLIPFNCLTVPLGKQWAYEIETCLDEYTTLEHINGVECFKCTLLKQKQQLESLLNPPHLQPGGEGAELESRLPEALARSVSIRLQAVMEALVNDDFSENALKNCQIPAKSRVSTTKSRQAVIARAPKVLVIHINRSVFDEVSGMQSKNYADVSFPQDLNLSPWCLGRNSGNEDTEMETWNVDPSKSLLLRNGKMKEMAESLYSLRAVVTHYGRHENGHYICYRKSPRSDIGQNEEKDESLWWRLSDDEVSSVSQENVLAQGEVFMLFYEQVEGSTSENPEQPNSADLTSTEQKLDILPEEGGLEADKIAINSDETTQAHVESEIGQGRRPGEPDAATRPISEQKKTITSPQTLTATELGSLKPSGTQFLATVLSVPEGVKEVHSPVLRDLDRSPEFQRKSPVYSGATKEKVQVAPVMRTSGVREKKDGASRARSPMTSISSMITAN